MTGSAEDFLRLCGESGLFGEEEIAAIRENVSAGNGDAKSLADELVRQGRLTRFQAANVLRGKAAALVLGNYIVLDKLGAGGMGVVYKARHRRMNRVVALKLLPAAVSRDERAVKRFQREVEAAAQLSHANIVTAFDADEADGRHFLVMELVDGEDLATLIKRRGIPAIEQAVDYVLQAARGLAYAHSRGVVHRDIKPSNLLLDSDGVVRILDMGLARIEQPDGDEGEQREELTGSGQIMGTVDYMAPEQSWDTRHADQRADIYSLGCTLFRLLTGEAPYVGETVVQRVIAHRESPVPSPQEYRDEVSDELAAVCQKMMAKRPDQRYQTMSEVVAALEGLSQDGGPPPPPVMDELPVMNSDAPFFGDETPHDGDVPDGPTVAEMGGIAVSTPTIVADGNALHPDLSPTGRAGQGRGRRSRRGVLAAAIVAILAVGGGWWYFSSSSTDSAGPNPGELPNPPSSNRTISVLMVLPQRYWYMDYGPVRQRLEQAGFQVEVASSRMNTARADGNVAPPPSPPANVEPDLVLGDAQVSRYDAVVVIGNADDTEFTGNGPQAAEIHQLLRAALREGGIIGGVCKGNLALMEAGVLRGLPAADNEYFTDAQRNQSGANWQDRPVVRSSNQILTGGDFNHSARFAEELVRMLRGAGQGE